MSTNQPFDHPVLCGLIIAISVLTAAALAVLAVV